LSVTSPITAGPASSACQGRAVIDGSSRSRGSPAWSTEIVPGAFEVSSGAIQAGWEQRLSSAGGGREGSTADAPTVAPHWRREIVRAASRRRGPARGEVRGGRGILEARMPAGWVPASRWTTDCTRAAYRRNSAAGQPYPGGRQTAAGQGIREGPVRTARLDADQVAATSARRASTDGTTCRIWPSALGRLATAQGHAQEAANKG